MFAKYVMPTLVSQAPRCIHIGNTTVVNPSAEQYAEAEYYEVIDNSPEQVYREFYHYETRYELKEPTEEHPLTWIDQTLVEVKDNRPLREDLIVTYIREQYNLNAELAIQRQRNNSPEKEEDFRVYNEYCDSCKVRADDYLARYDAA